MKVSVKFKLAFLLLMLSFSISGSALDFTTCSSFDDSSCQVSPSSEYCESSAFVNQDVSDFKGLRALSICDIEFGSRSISETYSYTNTYRLRKIIEGVNFLKDMTYKFYLLRENLLVLDQSKSYYSNKDSHYAMICSDYYVFALRRILI